MDISMYWWIEILTDQHIWMDCLIYVYINIWIYGWICTWIYQYIAGLIYNWISRCINIWIDWCIDISKYGWVYGYMDRSIFRWIDVIVICIYRCINILMEEWYIWMDQYIDGLIYEQINIWWNQFMDGSIYLSYILLLDFWHKFNFSYQFWCLWMINFVAKEVVFYSPILLSIFANLVQNI